MRDIGMVQVMTDLPPYLAYLDAASKCNYLWLVRLPDTAIFGGCPVHDVTSGQARINHM